MRTILYKILLCLVASLSINEAATAQTEYKDIFDMIRGRVAGVQVGQAGPGQMPQIYIRGIGTNSEHTQPLFIVDGIQSDNISYIDPKDVHSIDIIKDGTSSIYGMQGANGVIMVTTKSAVEAAQREAEARKAAKTAKKAAKKTKNQF